MQNLLMYVLMGVCSAHGVEKYTDEKLTTQAGLYFENQGPMKIMTTQWTIVASYDISHFYERKNVIDEYMGATYKLCNYLKDRNITQTNCETIYSLTKLVAFIAEEKRNIIYETIGRSRITKRGFPLKMIAKAAQIIFGLCDQFCVLRHNANVKKRIDTNTSEVNDVGKQLRVIKLEDEHERGPAVLIDLNDAIHQLTNMTNELNIKSYLAYHFFQTNLVLQLYLSETTMLFDVIQAAKVGLVHPSLMSAPELLKQFMVIKIGLPSGTDLPMELNVNNVEEMMPLSDITIYYSDDKIVFIITVPLVYQHELTLFQLIPIPICNQNNCLYVKPNHKYLAISKSKELYSTYDEIDRSQCKHANDFLMCPEIYPLHPRSVRPVCEVLLLQDPKEVPESCEIMHVQLQTNLFHKLKFKNDWIYATPGETVFITCDHDKRSKNHFLEGVGILSINETCRAYATRDILIPHKIEMDNEYVDFIPNSKIRESTEAYIGLNNNILKNKHVRTNQMFDLNIVAQSTSEIKEKMSRDVEAEEIKTSKTKHDYLLYVISAITIVSLILFLVSCIEQLPWCAQTRPTRQTHANSLGQETEVVRLPIYEQPEITENQQATLSSRHSPRNEIQQETLIPRSTAYSVYPAIPSL
ncbi:uncharacterized protein LOC132933186 [Metopolophium dirhodum]|uniref:uncharacterized protein LOC132933186 n=1 Tax=Metopolophium dirhodum TaxID=44670 RepID=UPI00299034CD|nr:uncharacterized protein LOC132933186 [Metopolophium dirhodum]